MSLQIPKHKDELFHLPTFAPSYANTEKSSKKQHTQNSLEKDSSDELTIGPAAQGKFFEKTLSQTSLINSIYSGSKQLSSEHGSPERC